MILDYRLKAREILTPVYGNWMYRNRTLDNQEFMENADELTIRKTRRREKVTLASCCVALPLGIGMFLGKFVL